MNDPVDNDAALDTALRAAPRDVAPSRDLWPAIHAVMQSDATHTPWRRPSFQKPWRQAAAALVLMTVTAAATYWFTVSRAPVAADAAMQRGVADVIAADYLRARIALDQQFAAKLTNLSPSTRAQVVSSLADLRRAADDLVAELERNPDNRLLQGLLISTYQSEARLLTDTSVMPREPI
jgi:hypothetical protein